MPCGNPRRVLTEKERVSIKPNIRIGLATRLHQSATTKVFYLHDGCHQGTNDAAKYDDGFEYEDSKITLQKSSSESKNCNDICGGRDPPCNNSTVWDGLDIL